MCRYTYWVVQEEQKSNKKIAIRSNGNLNYADISNILGNKVYCMDANFNWKEPIIAYYAIIGLFLFIGHAA